MVLPGDTVRDPDVASKVEKSGLVHPDALLEVQVSVEELPEVIDEGLAVRFTVGTAAIFVTQLSVAYPESAVARTVPVLLPAEENDVEGFWDELVNAPDQE